MQSFDVGSLFSKICLRESVEPVKPGISYSNISSSYSVQKDGLLRLLNISNYLRQSVFLSEKGIISQFASRPFLRYIKDVDHDEGNFHEKNNRADLPWNRDEFCLVIVWENSAQ